MHTQHLVIDETWYRRPPAAKGRITAGGGVLRQEDQCVYLALAREGDSPAPLSSPRAGLNQMNRSKRAGRREIAKKWAFPTCRGSVHSGAGAPELRQTVLGPDVIFSSIR